MSLKILSSKQQSFAHYGEGKVRERKPVALPNEDGGFKGYSTLFYWAHLWSKEGGTVEDHAHKGFEILTYVLEGSVEHYDADKDQWFRLDKGWFQVMRTGRGMNHSERFAPGTRVFQIALDPDLRKSLQKDPLYMDFEPDEFETEEKNGITRLDFTGDDSPVILSTKARVIKADMKAGSTFKEATPGEFFSAYVVSGKVMVDSEELEPGEFFLIKDRKEVVFRCQEDACVFMVMNPAKPAYKTYITQLQIQA